MTDFQKSLTRLMYLVVLVIAVLGVLALTRPSGRGEAFTSDGPYDRSSRGITTTGSCVMRVKPDIVQVTIAVKQSSKSARATQDFIKSTVAKVVKVLEDGGVATKDIQTQELWIESVWESGYDRKGRGWHTKKWNGEQVMQVRIRDLDKAGGLIDKALKSGANVVTDLRYTVENIGKVRDEGRQRAARIAYQKARTLTTALGGKLGRLVYCTEDYPEQAAPQANVNLQRAIGSDSQDAGLTIRPGMVVVNVSVTASYQVR